jgi:hypothetical protein
VNRHHEDATRPPQQALRAVPTRRILEGGCVATPTRSTPCSRANAFNRPVSVSPISIRIVN